MLLLKAITVLALSACALCQDERHLQDKDLFGPGAEDLLQERPLVFKPDEGHNFRRDFEQKHGYRGERLIAKLGGSPTPLSIYDASLIKHTTSAPVVAPSSAPRRSYHTTTTTSTTTTTEATTRHIRRKSFKKEETTEPTKRKYSSIHRLKKERKSSHRSSRKSSTEPTVEGEPSPYTVVEPTPGEELAVQKRLYRAVWNHGLRGLTESEQAAENLATLGSISNFNQLDLMHQLAAAIDQNQAVLQPSPQQSTHDLVQQKPDSSGNLPGDGLLLHALAQGASLDEQSTDSPLEHPEAVEAAEPSLQQYAGVGQPSLLVASYSYSEIGPRPSVRPRPHPLFESDDQLFNSGDLQQQLNAEDLQQQVAAGEQQPSGNDKQQENGNELQQPRSGNPSLLPESIFTSADQQPGLDSPIADVDDPFSGGSELRPQYVKP